jgi:phosphoribosyl 1,2-cyclic phosphodiesterase
VSYGSGSLTGYNSFSNFPAPYQQQAPFFANHYDDFGRQIFFRVPANPNWFDLVMTFSASTSSSTCNPFAIVLIARGTPYPFTGYVSLYDATSTGSPIWTSGSNTYCGSNSPQNNNTLIASIGPGDWFVWFVFNDSSVQIAATISFTWSSIGPSNVRLLTDDGG